MENKRKDGKVPCMVVTREQYKRDLKESLLEMEMLEKGISDFYEGFLDNFSEFPLLVINRCGNIGYLGNLSMRAKDKHDRFLIEPYDAELFLKEVRKCVSGVDEELNDVPTITEADLIGDLDGFPIEVVQKMVEEQVRQGDKADVTVFQEEKRYCNSLGVFRWHNTVDGLAFWHEVTTLRNFDLFFEKYPKEKIEGQSNEQSSENATMKHKVGDKVKIKSLEWYNENKDENGEVAIHRIFTKDLSFYCGRTATITEVNNELKYYALDVDSCRWDWSDEMFEEEFETDTTKDCDMTPKIDNMEATDEPDSGSTEQSLLDAFDSFAESTKKLHDFSQSEDGTSSNIVAVEEKEESPIIKGLNNYLDSNTDDTIEDDIDFIVQKELCESTLSEASRILGGDRQADYGDAVQNFENIAQCASEWCGKELTALDCVNVMIAVKTKREQFKHKRDNVVDLNAYMEIREQIINSLKY